MKVLFLDFGGMEVIREEVFNSAADAKVFIEYVMEEVPIIHGDDEAYTALDKFYNLETGSFEIIVQKD